jgi:hypothetical protein
MRTKHSFPALILLLVCMVLSGCSMTDPASANADPPLRVTPIDTSADEMIATILINEDQDATDRLSVVNLKMSIDAIEEDNYANFHHGEYVVCNGVKVMMGDTPLYTFKIDPSGYTCSYRGFKPGVGLRAAVTMIDVATRSRLLPQTPSFSSQGYTIRYTPDSSSLACPITAVATDSSGNTINGNASSSANGVYNGPNTGSLTGTGEIVLKRTCSWKFKDAFSLVNLTYQSTASIEVTWSH